LETRSTLQENLCDSIDVFIFQMIPECTSIGVKEQLHWHQYVGIYKLLALGTDLKSLKGLYSGPSPIHLIVYNWNLRIGK
jgi:hypothetical protein